MKRLFSLTKNPPKIYGLLIKVQIPATEHLSAQHLFSSFYNFAAIIQCIIFTILYQTVEFRQQFDFYIFCCNFVIFELAFIFFVINSKKMHFSHWTIQQEPNNVFGTFFFHIDDLKLCFCNFAAKSQNSQIKSTSPIISVKIHFCG